MAASTAGNRDMGHIAIIEDSDGAVARMNAFSLGRKTLLFTPSTADAARYRYAVSDGGYDDAAASAGTPLAALDDDDTRSLALPFSFPFFGAVYNRVFVNSDGNLTFTAGDIASSARSLGRMTAGGPRIAPLFDDLDPARTAGGVRVTAGAARFVVSWVAVPEWRDSGIGPAQTFQARLYPDGRIEFAWSQVDAAEAVVGIAPGNLRGETALVSFRNDPTAEYAAAVAERFGTDLAVDAVTVAQKFYRTHEDSYDYLVIYNNQDINAMPSAVAYEDTVRSAGLGYGVAPLDSGSMYGSASRLRAVLNMGQLSQYYKDPNKVIDRRMAAGDTTLTTLAHETGHLFLAFASVPGPEGAPARPMLNPDGAHWSFVFNSEASLLEGERIADRGEGQSPRFLTGGTAEAYSPLDRYLMGFGPPEDVPPNLFFYVTGAPSYLLAQRPIRGYPFDGVRHDVSIGDVILAQGRRTPDYTVAQRNFRFAFILLIPANSEPTADQLAQVDLYRRSFEDFFLTAAANDAEADTTLARSLKLSLFPAAGVPAGGTGSATLTLETAPQNDMPVELRTQGGFLTLPASVTVKAGATSASFAYSGVRAGVAEVDAVTPAGTPYETAHARVQVADPSMLKLVAVSGESQISTGAAPLPDPVVVRLTDANNLAYAGARLVAAASAGGSVTPAAVETDAAGQASFRWTPGPSPANQLQVAVEGSPRTALALSAGPAVPVAAAVVNSASWTGEIAPGALATIKGVNLAGGQTLTAGMPWPESLGGIRVEIDGLPAPLLYASDEQINFYVPPAVPQGSATLTVLTPAGTMATAALDLLPAAPGIFPGAVLRAGTTERATTSPVRAGEDIEIYCTGLGATHNTGGFDLTVLTPAVFVGSVPVAPTYSGLAPGYMGLYQVNVRVPEGLAAGMQPLLLSVGQAHSNEIRIAIE